MELHFHPWNGTIKPHGYHHGISVYYIEEKPFIGGSQFLEETNNLDIPQRESLILFHLARGNIPCPFSQYPLPVQDLFTLYVTGLLFIFIYFNLCLFMFIFIIFIFHFLSFIFIYFIFIFIFIFIFLFLFLFLFLYFFIFIFIFIFILFWHFLKQFNLFLKRGLPFNWNERRLCEDAYGCIYSTKDSRSLQSNSSHHQVG